MSTVSFDHQSFLVDGRRTWLVSGAIHYPRIPRELWRSRIRAAKQAGLNCISTYVFWNAHEPEPGHFNFDGNLDLRAFVKMVGEEGLYCWLRPGPFVGAEWDMGGMPPWLLRQEGMKLREATPAFMEASARYLGAVMGQVRDLQITIPLRGPAPAAPEGNLPGEAAGGFAKAGGGPILLVQAENEWFCHNPQQGDAYLREIVRYLRENGCEVPITNANNLWQRIDGTIDTWNAGHHLLADLRQLGVVQPEAPRLVSDFRSGTCDAWGKPRTGGLSSQETLARLAQIVAAGGQYNLQPFAGGTNFGFTGGRLGGGPDLYQVTSHDCDAPLSEGGRRTDKFAVIKRLSTMASQFHTLLAHLETDHHVAAVAPNGDGRAVSVVHMAGSQGDIVFLLRGENDKRTSTSLILPNGLTLDVPLDGQRAGWLMLNVNLGGVAQLDYTSLQPWAFLSRKMLVLCGPKGGQGVVSLDDVPLQINVPSGREPFVERHEDLTIVVLSIEQVDNTYIWSGGLAVHSAGLDDAGEPIPLPGQAGMLLVDLEGNTTKRKAATSRKPTAPRLNDWAYAGVDDIADGSSDAFEKIDGPMSLECLHQNQGYGWYRIGMGSATQAKVLIPEACDRLHLYSNGKLQTVVGEGPGASTEPASLRLGGDLVILVDNLGRLDAGTGVGECKGVCGHLFAVRAVKLPKPKVATQRGVDPFALRGYVQGMRRGDAIAAELLTWSVKPSGRKPMVLEVRSLPMAGLLSVNGEPLAHYDPSEGTGLLRLVLTPGEAGFKGGQNKLELALYQPLDGEKIDFNKHVALYQVSQVLSSRGQWAFARWRPPADDAFSKLPGTPPAQPAWYRAQFKVSDASAPLWLDPRGLTKGQIYLNGRNVGRYFVATRQGKAVGPQKLYYLPEAWLRTDEPNVLMLFDEHGKLPRQCRLVYGDTDAFGKG